MAVIIYREISYSKAQKIFAKLSDFENGAKTQCLRTRAKKKDIEKPMRID